MTDILFTSSLFQFASRSCMKLLTFALCIANLPVEFPDCASATSVQSFQTPAQTADVQYLWALLYVTAEQPEVSVGPAICASSDTNAKRNSVLKRRSFRTQQVNQHTFLCTASLAQKALAAHVWRR
jgi:hypothetical protein